MTLIIGLMALLFILVIALAGIGYVSQKRILELEDDVNKLKQCNQLEHEKMDKYIASVQRDLWEVTKLLGIEKQPKVEQPEKWVKKEEVKP